MSENETIADIAAKFKVQVEQARALQKKRDDEKARMDHFGSSIGSGLRSAMVNAVASLNDAVGEQIISTQHQAGSSNLAFVDKRKGSVPVVTFSYSEKDHAFKIAHGGHEESYKIVDEGNYFRITDGVANYKPEELLDRTIRLVAGVQ